MNFLSFLVNLALRDFTLPGLSAKLENLAKQPKITAELEIQNKGTFKYYDSAFGGVGGLSQNADMLAL